MRHISYEDLHFNLYSIMLNEFSCTLRLIECYICLFYYTIYEGTCPLHLVRFFVFKINIHVLYQIFFYLSHYFVFPIKCFSYTPLKSQECIFLRLGFNIWLAFWYNGQKQTDLSFTLTILFSRSLCFHHVCVHDIFITNYILVLVWLRSVHQFSIFLLLLHVFTVFWLPSCALWINK